MRRACSSDVRSVSFLGRDGPVRPESVAGVYRAARGHQASRYRPRRSISAATAAARDRRSAARRDPLADLGRGDGERRDREQLDASGRDSDAITASRPLAIGARPRRGADAARARAPAPAASTWGTPQARRRRSGTRDRRARAPRASRPCGANGIERHLGHVERCERELGEREPDRRGACRPPCGPGRRRRARAGARAGSARPPRAASATCPLCGGSKAPPRIPTSRSLPDHDLVADLDLGARLAPLRPAVPPRAPRPRAACRRPGSPGRSGAP